MTNDCRTETQKLADNDRIQKKTDRDFKAGEIECFFLEINKVQKERDILIKQGNFQTLSVKELNSHISEGLVDLDREIQGYKDMLESQGEPIAQAQEFLKRWSKVKHQEESQQGSSVGGKVSLQANAAENSELQDLSVL